MAQMTDTTSMIAVGREPKRKVFYECGTWFIIKPAHSSREFSVFGEFLGFIEDEMQGVIFSLFLGISLLPS